MPQEKVMSYGEVSDLYGRLAEHPLFKQNFGNMGDFAKWYREQTGSPEMMAGEHPSLIKDVSSGFDKLLRKTQVPQALGEVGSGLFKAIGLDPEYGRSLGEGFPRGALEMGSSLAGAAMLPIPPLTPVGAGLMALGGASAGAHTYTETDSPFAGLVTGGLTAALGPSEKLGQAALQPLGKRFLAQRVPVFSAKEGVRWTTKPAFEGTKGALLEKSFDFLGKQTGLIGNMELANVSTSAILGQRPDFSAEHWAGLAAMALPTLPFTVVDAIRGPRGGKFRSDFSKSIAEENFKNEALRTQAEAQAAKNSYLSVAEASERAVKQAEARKAKQAQTNVPEELQSLMDEAIKSALVDAEKTLLGIPLEKGKGKGKSKKAGPSTIPFMQGEQKPVPRSVELAEAVEPTQVTLDKGQGKIPFLQGEPTAPEVKVEEPFVQPELRPTVESPARETAAKVVELTAKDPEFVPTTPEKLAAVGGALNDVLRELSQRELSDARLLASISSWHYGNLSESLVKTSRMVLNKAVDASESLMKKPLNVEQLPPVEVKNDPLIFFLHKNRSHAEIYTPEEWAKYKERNPDLLQPWYTPQAERPLDPVWVRHRQLEDLLFQKQRELMIAQEAASKRGQEGKTPLELLDEQEKIMLKNAVEQAKKIGLKRYIKEFKGKITKDQVQAVEATAMELLQQLPPEKQAVATEAYSKISGRYEDVMDADISLNVWVDLMDHFNSKEPHAVEFRALLETKPEEAQTMLMKRLSRVAGDTANRGRGRRRPDSVMTSEGAEPLFDDLGNEHPGSQRLSLVAEEALNQGVERNLGLMRERESLANPITLEELKAVDPKATDLVLTRMRVLWQLMLDGSVRREVHKGRTRLNYNEYAIAELKGYWGGEGKWNRASMASWISKNLPTMQKVLQNRIEMQAKVEPSIFTAGEPFSVFTLAEPSGSGRFGLQAYSFFNDYFRTLGYTRESAQRLAKIAHNVGSMFPEVDKFEIAQLETILSNNKLGSALFGLYKGGSVGDVVGISKTAFNAFKAKSLREFAMISTLAHEGLHGMMRAAQEGRLEPERAAVFNKALSLAEELTPQQRNTLIVDLARIVLPVDILRKAERPGAMTDMEGFLAVLLDASSRSPEEFLASVNQLVAAGIVSPAKAKPETFNALREYVMLSPQHLSDFVSNLYLDLSQITTAVKDWLNLSSGTLGNVSKMQVARLTEYIESMGKLARTSREMEAMASKIVDLDNMMEGGLPTMYGRMTAIVGGPESFNDPNVHPSLNPLFKEVRDWMAPSRQPSDTVMGVKPNFFEKNFMTAAWYAERFPMARPVIDLGYQYRAIANDFGTQLLKPFMFLDKKGRPKFDPEHAGFTRILNDERLRSAFDAIALWQNDKMAKMEGASPEEMRITLKEMQDLAAPFKLSADDLDLIVNTFDKTMESMAAARRAQVSAQQQKNGFVAAHTFMSIGMDAESARLAGNYLQAAVWHKMQGDRILKADPTNPTGISSLEQSKRDMQHVMSMVTDKEALKTAIDDVSELHQHLLEFQDSLQQMPWFTPEVRIGRYFVVGTLTGEKTDGKKSFVAAFHNTKQANEAYKKLEAREDYVPGTIKMYDKMDNLQDVNLLTTQQARIFAELEKAAFERGVERLKARDPEAAEDLIKIMNYVPGKATAKEMVARNIGKHSMIRTLTPGRETLNMMEGVVDYIVGLSMGLAKSHVKDAALLYLSDKSLKDNKKVRNQLRDYLSQVVDPPTKEFTKLKKAIFTMTLGMNLSSMLIERAQPMFSLVPYLTSKGSGLRESYKFLWNAIREVGKLEIKDGTLVAGDPQLHRAMQQAVREQVFDHGVYQELSNMTDLGLANLRNLVGGNKTVNTIENFAARPVIAYANFAQKMYTNQTAKNSQIAFVANWKFAREKLKMDEGDAYYFAVQGVRSTMYGGGAAGRPLGLFSNLGKLYGAAGVWYTLQQYTVSSISQMYKLWMDGFSRNKTQGLTPEGVKNAKKAFTQMFLTQFAAAGAMGLPMVGLSTAMLEQLFPNLNIKQGIREGLDKWGDEETGEIVSDSILHGFATKTLGLGAIDLSSRFSLGQLFGLDPERGFVPENIFGAAGGVIGNWIRAVKAGAPRMIGGEGDMWKAAKFGSPTGFWKPFVSYMKDNMAVRDNRGRLIYEPTEGEKMAMMIGFRPKEVSRYHEQRRMSERAADIQARDLRDFHEEVATHILNGQLPMARALLLEKNQQDPLYNPHAGLTAAVKLAQEMTEPADPSARGSSSSILERQRIAQTFPARPQVSEVDRYLRRKQVETAVGLPGGGIPSRSQLRQASLVDQLLQMNPAISPQHARVLVERMTGRTFSGTPLDVHPAYSELFDRFATGVR